jgi:hypothetical protein
VTAFSPLTLSVQWELFSLESSFLVSRTLIFHQRTAIPSMLTPGSLPRQDKLFDLLIPYQNQIPARPGCSIGVSLASLYSHGFFPGTGTGLMGISPGGYDVLTCRQVARVASALAKASHVLAIDGHDKAQILPKICDPSDDYMP